MKKIGKGKRGRKRSVAAEEPVRPGTGAPFPIVGVGASAGGLEAFTQFLGALPPDIGMGFVLVQHLDPDHESALVQILGRATPLPVAEVENGQRVRANHVYVIPRNTNLRIDGGVLTLQRRPRTRQPHRAIDSFFESLAQDQRELAIGVVLSGTASDGTLGLEAIKAEGGFTFAQDASAKYDSMPRSAVAAGCVDLVLPPAGIANEIARIAKHPYAAPRGPAPTTLGENENEAAEAQAAEGVPPSSRKTGSPTPGAKQAHAEDGPAPGASSSAADDGQRQILLLLRNHSGVDFASYKASTIQRRIARRVVLSGQESLAGYASLLRRTPKEIEALLSDVLISVTSFFRNPETFDVLQRRVLPEILKRHGPEDGDTPVRAWVPGCSTGQEAYSLAMVLVEAMEGAPRSRRLQVFATDVNDAVLQRARPGLYAKSLVEDVSPQRLRRFFTEEDGGYRVNKMLREIVVFARQNFIADPPFSRMDIISCRNLLIYLEPSLQRRLFPALHYALKPGGFLVLGASESIGGFTNLFEPVDKKHKIYSKTPSPGRAFQRPLGDEARERPPARSLLPPPASPGLPAALSDEAQAQREADRIILRQFAPPGVLVSADLQVLQFRGQTGAFLEPPIGKARFDLLKMARQGLVLPLRSAINEAKKEQRPARRDNVRVRQNGEERTLDVNVIPLTTKGERCFLILFEEAGTAARAGGHPPAREAVEASGRRPRRPAEAQAKRVAELEAELLETREYLQSIQEQHEAANEELQSANEEIQSANEELQSVNEELETSKEELETSKEELESANEELTTVNDEMSHRNIELSHLNSDLVNLQNSTNLAVVLLGRDLRIRRFSPQAAVQVNLLITDLGRPISHIRHDLVRADAPESPLDLEGLSSAVISSVREQEHEVRDAAGRRYSLRVRPYLTSEGVVDGAVLVLVDVTTLKHSEQAMLRSEARYRAMFESASVGVCERDADKGRLLRVNEAFARMVGRSQAELAGRTLFELTHPDDRAADQEGYSRLCRGEVDLHETESRLIHKNGTILWTHVTVNLVRDVPTHPIHTVTILFDITERKRAEAALRESTEAATFLAEIVRSSQDAIITRALDGTITSWNQGAERIFGYSSDEVLGRSISILGAAERPRDEAQLMANLKRGARIESYETVRRRKDGSVVDVSLTISPVKDKDGRIIGASKIARDITESKRLEKELRRFSAELEEVDRRKDEFLAMLGHEIRNPLSALAHGLEILGKVSDDRARAEELRLMMTTHSARIALLLDQLLDVARVRSGTIELANDRVDLAEVIRAAAATVRSFAESDGHQISLSLPFDETALVRGDAVRLSQVVENLLTNAVRYTEKGGKIDVALVLEGATARIRVRDNGIGMSAAFLPRVFDVFTQEPRASEASRGGLGLGLALVRRLVELHGGQISASSPGPGQGSEFCVTLPRLTEKHPQKLLARERVSPVPVKIRPRRILVVDDEKDAARALAAILELDGHQTLVVTEGQSALQAMRTFDPELVLLDLGLPGMDGYETATRLRAEQRDKRAQLIAVSGYRSDVARLKAAGFDGHLLKPPNLQKLAALLAAWDDAGDGTG